MISAEFFVQYALSIGAIDLRPEGWKLRSGRISPYFFNSGLFCDGKSFAVLAEAYASLLYKSKLVPNRVLFGPPYKGTFLVPGIALSLSCNFLISVGFASWRKERKLHGEGGAIIGCDVNKAEVVIVDDVITTAETACRSIELIVQAGGRVIAYAVALDRQERTEEENGLSAKIVQERCDVPVFSIAKLSDLVEVLQKESSPRAEQYLPKIIEYQKIYGIQ